MTHPMTRPARDRRAMHAVVVVALLLAGMVACDSSTRPTSGTLRDGPPALPRAADASAPLSRLLTAATPALPDLSPTTPDAHRSLGTPPTLPIAAAASPAALQSVAIGPSPSILWEDLATGARGYFAMSGSTLGAWTPIGTVSTELRTVGYADFTGDNLADMLFENSRDGSRWVLQLNATDVPIAWRPVNTVPTEWHITGVATLTNGATADILWQNTLTGEIGLYRMNGTSVLGWVGIGRVDADLRMVAVGDFTGDGKPDLVFENLRDGKRWVLQMNGATAIAWWAIGAVPTELRIRGVGDFTGDGQLDLLFENTRDGSRWILRMTGTTAQAWIALATLPTSWHITGTRINATVNAALGTLQLEITGIAAGTAANVTLVGPNGAQMSVAAAGAVTLAAGTWTMTANATGANYPVIPVQTIVIATGQAAAVRVRYAPFPVSGAVVPSLVAFDDSMIAFMRARNIPAGEIEIVHAGQTVFARGYGWADKAKSTVFSPGSPMRTASLAKPMDAAAIRQLIAAGKFSYGTLAFAYLGLSALPANAVVDPRLASITVQQLLDHTGGFGPPGSAPDSRTISTTLGLTRPPTTAEVIQYMMGQPLMYTPGTTYAYSNVGYLILGLIVEKASQQDFVTYVKQHHFAAPFIPDLQLARTRPTDRDAREPWYSDPTIECSVFVLATCTPVTDPDGGFYYEAYTSCCGLVVTPGTYLAFMGKFWGDGSPRLPGQIASWAWIGRLDGTFAIARWRPDGTMFTAFFDQVADASGLDYDNFWQTLDLTTDAITKWP